jgi:hypothetical protein
LASFNVTKRALALGSRDSWSGWRAKSWTESTIEMIIVPRGATQMALLAGTFPKLDAVGLTDDAAAVGDQVKDSAGIYYTVASIKDNYWGDSLIYRECDLSKETMYQTDFGSTTWSLTRGSDPRYRSKVWMETYLRPAQITKDDDSTKADFACIFNNPPYPLHLEYRGSSNMNGLYVIDQPNSSPEVDSTHYTIGYVEHVPLHIMTVDSTDCTGTALAWKMEAELRYINETYPLGSLRFMGSRRKQDANLGQILYDIEYSLDYKRDIST